MDEKKAQSKGKQTSIGKVSLCSLVESLKLADKKSNMQCLFKAIPNFKSLKMVSLHKKVDLFCGTAKHEKSRSVPNT